MKRLAVLLLVFLLAGCSGVKSPADSGTASQPGITEENSAKTINMYSLKENDLNPLLTSSESGRLMLSLVYRPLITVNQNFDWSYSLAEAVNPSTDCKSFYISLRRDVTWSDGSAFTSSDLDYTLEKIFEYGELSPYYRNIKNISGYSPDGSYGYSVYLEESDAGFPLLLTFPIVKKGSLENGVTSVGTGEYTVSDYVKYTSYVLNARNPKGTGFADRINVTMLPDKDSAFSSYRLGKLDILKVTSDDTTGFTIDGSKASVDFNSNLYTFLAVNHNNANLSDVAVRRLIVAITSGENVIQDLAPEFALKADSFVNPASCYAIKNETEFDNIKESFDRLGYVADENGVRYKAVGTGSRKLSVNILVNSDNPSKVIAAEYISNLLKNYGFSTSVTKVGYSLYLDSLIAGDFDLALCETDISLNGDYRFLIGTDGSANFGNYSNEKIDSLLDSISTTYEKNARTELMKQLQLLFYSEVPHIPLWFKTSKIVYNSSLFENTVPGGINEEYSTISSWTVR